MKTRRVPRYLLHKRSGHARVIINGVEHHLGKHGSPESKLKYDQLIADYLADVSDPVGMTVNQLCMAYWKFAKVRYGNTGKGKFGAAINWRPVLELLRDHYGDQPARDFGPKALKNLLPAMEGRGWSRSYVNRNRDRIKQIFRWAVSEELLPVEVYTRLMTVENVRRGQTNAPENEPIQPVADDVVETTVKELRRPVADIVRFQRLTGCRPGEAVRIRPRDVDRRGAIWVYRLADHKTAHHGKSRDVYIGPKAQRILAPYLLKAENHFCFQTRCGNPYDTDLYRLSIHRACDRLDIPRWSPNRLRHTHATEVRERYDIEHVAAALGHSNLSTSEIYATRSASRATEVAKQLG